LFPKTPPKAGLLGGTPNAASGSPLDGGARTLMGERAPMALRLQLPAEHGSQFSRYVARGDIRPATIERELGWASGIGFNALRTNLHYLDWRHDRDGLINRIDRFLDIAARHGIDSMLCLFDDCEFSGEPSAWGHSPARVRTSTTAAPSAARDATSSPTGRNGRACRPMCRT
jgi:hypothetical protein